MCSRRVRTSSKGEVVKKDRRGKARNIADSPRPDLFAKAGEEDVIERFNRLVEAMAKTPAQPKKKKRPPARKEAEGDAFDD